MLIPQYVLICMCIYIYIYIYIFIYMSLSLSIYIYKERERERDITNKCTSKAAANEINPPPRRQPCRVRDRSAGQRRTRTIGRKDSTTHLRARKRYLRRSSTIRRASQRPRSRQSVLPEAYIYIYIHTYT